MNLIVDYVPEPGLQFRFGQELEYTRDGLYLYGPVDAEVTPRPIRYGYIGTKDGLERFCRWSESVSTFIDVPPPRRGSKPVEPHHVPFPGMSEAFFSAWPKRPARVIDDISEQELHAALRIGNRHEAVKRAVDIFVSRLETHRARDEDPPSFWFVVLPDFVYTLGRPQSKVGKADRVEGEVKLTKKAADKMTTQPNLFGFDEEDAEVYKYERNFRRQLKARLLNSQVVTQLVRESTLTPNDFLKSNGQPRRRVEDPATIAWKLGAGAYYKAGGRPWQIARMRPGVCYVGLVYKRAEEAGRPRFSVCAAQMFLSDGEGVVFRGALGPWYNPDTKQFHLDEAAAGNLVRMVAEEYRARHGAAPKELFVHAKAAFSEEEWVGFQAAVAGTGTNLVGVQISDAYDELKLFRNGGYPVVRGTVMYTGPRSGYLWTTGYVPRLDTYMGPDTPNPLFVSIRRGEHDISTVMADVMALTKINFNTCLFNDRSPVTIRFADAIGDVLVAAPVDGSKRLPFKFYI